MNLCSFLLHAIANTLKISYMYVEASSSLLGSKFILSLIASRRYAAKRAGIGHDITAHAYKGDDSAIVVIFLITRERV